MTWQHPGDPLDLARAAARGLGAPGPGGDVLVAAAPGRVNLIGEHTDYNAGLCLPLALPHATYAAARRRDDGTLRLTSAQADEPWEGTLADGGRADGWAAYVAGVLWALSEDGVPVPGLDLHLTSTVPLGAGLSSSASVECAAASAVAGLLDLPDDASLRDRLARACMRAEAEVAGAPTGGMDQAISLHGRAGHALLIDFDSGEHRQVPLALDEAGLALLVVDTRVSHELTDGGYASRRADCERAAELLGLPTLRAARLDDLAGLSDERIRARAWHVVTENARVEACVDALEVGAWHDVGALMDASHASLRDDFEVSCAELDTVVGAATGAGALGARMTGGGFGGSAVVLLPADRGDAVADAVVAAAAQAGHPEPAFLAAAPSAGAHLVG